MRFDMHMHTHYSWCATQTPQDILKRAKKLGLNGVAITDHNTTKGGKAVKKLNKDKDFTVIPGIEVSTDRGHTLGLYVTKDIKNREFFAAVKEIRDQGGVAVIAHPFRVLPHLKAKLDDVNIKKDLDGIEGMNGRTNIFANNISQRFAHKNSKGMTAGSDGHFTPEIGRCITHFEGDFRDALLKGKTTIEDRRLDPFNFVGNASSGSSFLIKNLWKRWHHAV